MPFDRIQWLSSSPIECFREFHESFSGKLAAFQSNVVLLICCQVFCQFYHLEEGKRDDCWSLFFWIVLFPSLEWEIRLGLTSFGFGHWTGNPSKIISLQFKTNLVNLCTLEKGSNAKNIAHALYSGVLSLIHIHSSSIFIS